MEKRSATGTLTDNCSFLRVQHIDPQKPSEIVDLEKVTVDWVE